MGALIRFIFEIIVIMWLIRVLLRFVAPFLFTSIARKAQRQAEEFYQQQQRQYQYQQNQYQHSQPKGSIHVDYVPPTATEKRKPKLDNAGDFVDYEEVN
ncbi:DUF4834 family protein [Solitalea koreensis]|uniref:DUF4834 domain-containing protein n=1 Tax=Solitalea koreensis TaxID=543615 RepID=A0A521CMI3_9SPHI|nr:DUF4834 family protein [Solitalea koreensis]SMO60652.1 protein of unknown function [Solitalea koreensis]